MSKPPTLGPTGQFPRGKMHDADEGELTMAIVTERSSRKIVMRFGKHVAWIGMDPEHARELARLLIQHADGLEQ